MRIGSAALEDPLSQKEQPTPSSPAPGKQPRTARLVGDPAEASEPMRPAAPEGRPAGEAGHGSFMPPMHELRVAKEDAAEEKPARSGEKPARSEEKAGPPTEEKKNAPPRDEKGERRTALANDEKNAKGERRDAKGTKKDTRNEPKDEKRKNEDADPVDVIEADIVEEDTDEAAEADEDAALDGDLDVGEEIPHLALLVPTPSPAEGAPPAGLDAVAVEAELDSAIEAVDAPDGPEGKRPHLARVAEIAGGRRRVAQAEVDAENAELDLEEESIDQRVAGGKQEGATLLAGKRRRKTDEAHSTHAGRLRTRAASRDELKQELVAAQADEKNRAADMLTSRLVDLETSLAGQLAGLMEEQKLRDAEIVLEFAARNTELATRIEEKRKAHEKQIEREKIALEIQAETEKVTVRAEAAAQSHDIVTSAEAQAAYTLTEAGIHAGNVEAKASKEAQAADAAGETKAQQAIDAAEDRANAAAADESERASILDEGQRRANLARAQAQTRKAEITLTGANEAAGIRDKGKADSEGEKERGERESVAAVERGEAAVVRVEDELAAGVATMQLQSTMALAEMENERALAMLELEQDRALALTKMATELALASVKIEQERTAAVIALHTEHDNLVASIDLRITTSLTKVDAASDKDLARLQRQVDRDLAAIDRQVQKAERRMDTQVAKAEARAKADVARRRVAIRKAARDVLRAIDGVVAKAAGAIDQADEDTSQEISDAAVIGVQSIQAESEEARDDNRTASETAIREQEAAAQAARSETSTLATDASQAMEDDRKALDGEIDQQWVGDALARSGELLSRDGTDWAVTDEESVEAMHVMASLPPHLQGQVIDNLSDDQFDELLSEMDEERHEHLEPLVAVASDPERKLELFAAFHTSKVTQDAERAEDDWLASIAEETDEEMEDELGFLQDKGTLTVQDVDDLIARKELEHQIEEEFRVNLTNERGGVLPWDNEVRADGTKIVWTTPELLELQATLDEMPEAHVRGNTMLEEIHRQDMAMEDYVDSTPNIGAHHDDGTILFYDTGSDPKYGYRHTGHARESLDPDAPGGLGGNITRLEEVIIHEVGHDIHDQNESVWERFQEAAGWEKDVDQDDLRARGFSDSEIEDMEDNEKGFAHDGGVFHHRYGEFSGFDEGRIPTTGQPGPRSGKPRDTWSYARTNYKDHFAETYMKAVVVPEQLAQDLIDDPAARVAADTVDRDMAVAARDTAAANLEALKATRPPPPLKDLAAAYQIWLESGIEAARSQKSLDQATADQEGMAEQYRIMRDDIFHAGDEVAAARARLEAKGITAQRLQDFLDKAARLSTPEQIQRLEARYP